MTDLRLGPWQMVLADVPDASVRLILTSPPYEHARRYENGCPSVDFAALAAFCLRVLVPGGTLAMVLDGPVNDGVASWVPYRVICEWGSLDGWRFSQLLAYGRQGSPGEYRGRFRRDHEPLIVFRKLGGDVVCNKHVISGRPRHAYPVAGTTRERNGNMRGRSSRPDLEPVRHRGSFWWYGPVGHDHDPSSSTGHPATFAEAFALDAVRVWSDPGDVVCDPFTGSGTVARACIDTGRAFVGAEIERRYHSMAVVRCAQTVIAGAS